MTSSVIEMPARRVPPDTFPIRLAIVRAAMGWNYDQAEAATGINSESWRSWEKAIRRCTNVERISRTVASATGFSWEWLMVGGPLGGNGSLPPAGPLAQSAELRTFNPKTPRSDGVVIALPTRTRGTVPLSIPA